MDQPESEYLREEEPLPYEEPALMRQEQDNQASGLRSCPGVSYEGKCYEFFRGPKKAVDAEFFCQQQFHEIHAPGSEDSDIWIAVALSGWMDPDGPTDWLSGEPNHTSNLETASKCCQVESSTTSRVGNLKLSSAPILSERARSSCRVITQSIRY
ncbi:hypothetical protein D5F01_LYC01552 [Larimichthys crocea]|uniref:C-type lectin domain-containing protein n=1 Tax=Larimichthys crocea TaxID=215358 RepID=A0A6G0J626_LARCR|nr:hypothetical protein D5F01_LYC01552 [Larimichthys crocea]